MTDQKGLFFQTIRTLIRDGKDEDKLRLADELLADLCKREFRRTRIVTIGEHLMCTCFTNRVGKILHRLNSYQFEPPDDRFDTYYVHNNHADHPYVIEIVKTIGKLAIFDDENCVIEERTLPLTSELDGEEVFEGDYRDITLNKLRERTGLLPDPKVRETIFSVLSEEGISVNEEEVKLWVASVTQKL